LGTYYTLGVTLWGVTVWGHVFGVMHCIQKSQFLGGNIFCTGRDISISKEIRFPGHSLKKWPFSDLTSFMDFKMKKWPPSGTENMST